MTPEHISQSWAELCRRSSQVRKDQGSNMEYVSALHFVTDNGATITTGLDKHGCIHIAGAQPVTPVQAITAARQILTIAAEALEIEPSELFVIRANPYADEIARQVGIEPAT